MLGFIVLNILLIVINSNICFGMHLLQKPIVGIELTEAGMHRDLLYTIQFDYPLAGKECDYILEQNLPAAVYISVDQLDDLNRLKKIDALYPEFVDVESPTEKAESFKVLLKGVPKITDSFKLPIHYRYHAPRPRKKFVNVELVPPKMYLLCPAADRYLIEPELQEKPGANYCLDEKNLEFKTSLEEELEDDVVAYEACQWKLIQIELQLKTSLVAKIPVGDSDGLPPILITTIIVSWIVSIWTVYRTHSVPSRINMKLNGQQFERMKKTN